jgi:hypothetical protein
MIAKNPTSMIGVTVPTKPSNSLIECACFCADLLWCNVKPIWRVATTPFWLLFPIFYIASLILEAATAEPENPKGEQ